MCHHSTYIFYLIWIPFVVKKEYFLFSVKGKPDEPHYHNLILCFCYFWLNLHPLQADDFNILLCLMAEEQSSLLWINGT